MSSVAFSAAPAMYQDRLRESAVRNRRTLSRHSALRRFFTRRGVVAHPTAHVSPDGVLR